MNSHDDACLLIDWGTSKARAWLVAPDGEILSRNLTNAGIRHISEGGFPAAYTHLTEGLSPEPLPTLMSGMVGSRQGWVEADYLDCPVEVSGLAQKLTTVPGASHIRIVPGVHSLTASGNHDVLRGEEIQIAGALELNGRRDQQLFCLPGTHSKWVTVKDDVLVDFHTSMTGEIFSILSEHSILAAMFPDISATGDISKAGFDLGLQRAGNDGGILHHLFSVRSEALFATIAPKDLRGYLSGILIGHEVHEMMTLKNRNIPVVVISDSHLGGLYVRAITKYNGTACALETEQVTIAGLRQVQTQAAQLAS